MKNLSHLLDLDLFLLMDHLIMQLGDILHHNQTNPLLNTNWQPGCLICCGAACLTTNCMEHARQQTLREYIDVQIHRMLDDPRSRALGRDFGGQWLQLSKLKSIRPDKDVFPEFDGGLRAAMRTETQMFVAAVIRE